MSMFDEIPVDVGVIYVGERVRRNDMHVELGGPQIEDKFELVRFRQMDEIEDGKIEIVGSDIDEMSLGDSYPFGMLIEVAGEQVEEDLEGVIERRLHEYVNYIEGFMHLNQRYDIWLRLSKKSFNRGFNSFKYLGVVLQKLFKSELPIIEKIQITFFTDPEKAKRLAGEAKEIYDARDAKARGLSDAEVDTFYGCSLCQSFAPPHVCVITPQRYSNCGAISWFDGRAAARVDPKGPLFTIDKGECLDDFKGEYTGANSAVKEKSLGEVERVYLYTAFEYPHTSCGCFEGVAFYIPEVDGMGLVHRNFGEKTINGLPFSTLADSTAGGRQIDGFHGISIEYMRSPKFLQADGGWNRVVWIPSEIKERVKEYIPSTVITKIATETDVTTIDELKTFLEEKQHPVTERWITPIVETATSTIQEEEKKEEVSIISPMPMTTIPMSGGGFKIILKDAKIVAKKLIIRSIKKGE